MENQRKMSVSRVGMTLALSLLGTTALTAQAPRVGYVDSNAVLAEYAPAQEARTQLETAQQDATSELQLLESGLQTAIGEFQQQAMSMTPEARQGREAEISNQQQALIRRRGELEVQFQQRQAELLQPVMDRITAVIEEVRVEGNYAIILDRASQVILAADPALDLTQEVVTRLQADADTGGR